MSREEKDDVQIEFPRDVYNVLLGVVGGVDVFGRREAEELRLVEQHAPRLIEITACTRDYDGAGRLPYFHAKLTAEGLRVVRAHRRFQKSRQRASRCVIRDEIVGASTR